MVAGARPDDDERTVAHPDLGIAAPRPRDSALSPLATVAPEALRAHTGPMSSATEQPDPGLRPELLGDEPVRRRRHEPEPEWIEVREARPPWRPPRWLWWAVAVALVVGSVAWYADHRVRTHEVSALAGCEHRLSDASALTEVRMGAMSNYLRPALATAYGSKQLHLADLMSGPARRMLPEVRRADRVCGAVTVEPWHFSLVARRNAATAYSGALLTLLQAVAAQGRAYFHHDATLARLREAAGVDSGLD